MKRILAYALLASLALAFSPLEAEAQNTIVRKPKTGQKKQITSKGSTSQNTPKKQVRHSSVSPELQQELNKLANNMVQVQGGTFTMGGRSW